MLSRPMLMNVNNTFGKCPNKTDELAVFLLGMRSAMKRYPSVLGVNGKVISECSLYSPPNRSYILNSFKFCCRAVWNHSHCRRYSAWVLLFLCVLVSTQRIRAAAFSFCLTNTGFSYCIERNAESGTKPMTNS